MTIHLKTDIYRKTKVRILDVSRRHLPLMIVLRTRAITVPQKTASSQFRLFQKRAGATAWKTPQNLTLQSS
jgi:hypothetical protein